MSRSNPTIDDLLGARRVLAVQPHYDDNDIGCAGTIRRLVLAGAEVTYVTVTDDLAGVLDPDLPDDEAATGLLAEQQQAAAVLGVNRLVNLGWPDAGGLDHVGLRDQVIAIIREHTPDLVLTVDPWLAHEAHRDHVVTGLAVSEAVLLSDLPRIHRMSAAQPWGVDLIGYYDTADATVVVDTSQVQAERHAVLDCYRLQFTDESLAGLHRTLDRYERSLATGGATHGEPLKLLPRSALHIGVGRRR
jgi:LmbE family N-acetylglucosaminyl deacetylase